MTESGYRPEYAAPQGAQHERLVFVDPLDPQAREFHIGADQRIGADSPDADPNQAVEDAYAQMEQEREYAAASTPEAVQTPEVLLQDMLVLTQRVVAARASAINPEGQDPFLN
jgi:hypothetical protein